MESWQLTEEEEKRLSKMDLLKYKTAMEYKSHDWAYGPWGGWSRGNDILKELGWTEKKHVVGHRIYISLNKPSP